MSSALPVMAVSGGISAISTFRSSKKKNRALEARMAWLQEEKKYQNKMFEIQTFQKSFSNEAAGARRLGRAASSGLGISGARVSNAFDDIFATFDTKVRGMVHEHQMRRLDNEINTLSKQKVDPLTEAFWSGLGSGLETGIYSGFLGPKDPPTVFSEDATDMLKETQTKKTAVDFSARF